MAKVTYYKIHKTQGGSFRVAHLEVTDDEVTAASPALAFMISWHINKVKVRAAVHGFHVSFLPTGTRNTTFITERPSIEERKKAKE
jgi:hypothetical protein